MHYITKHAKCQLPKWDDTTIAQNVHIGMKKHLEGPKERKSNSIISMPLEI